MDVAGARLAAAFGLTVFAGLATGVGSAIAFFARKSGTRFLSVALGFSAGVMLYVSFVEILAKARSGMAGAYGARTGAWLAVASFFVGLAVMGLIDALVPQFRNPHAARGAAELQLLRSTDGSGADAPDPRLLRMGLFSALAIAIHNFPEGVATFFAALDDPRLGVAIATAVALHNIPEGVSVSVPIFYATQNRRLAFRLSLLSGLAEPVGAVLAWLLLAPFITPGVTGALFGGVAGVMVYIALDELAPTAREYGEGHVVIAGIVAGMLVMAVSLLLMAP